jgi:hypothetical protein
VAIRTRIFRVVAAAALLVSAPAAVALFRGVGIPGDTGRVGSDIADFSASGASDALSATLTQKSADTAELTVDESGGDLDSYFTVRITGLGGYTVTATPAGLCSQSGAQLDCAYSTPLSSSDSAVSITLAFSGGSGPADLTAAVTGYLLDAVGIAVGAGDTAKATLDWTPGQPGSTVGSSAPGSGSGPGGTSGSAGGAGGTGSTGVRSNVVPVPATAGAGPGVMTPQVRSAPSTRAGSSASSPTHLGAGSAVGGSGPGWVQWTLIALALVLAGAGAGCLYIARRRTKAAYAAAAAYVPPAFDPKSVSLDTLEHSFQRFGDSPAER